MKAKLCAINQVKNVFRYGLSMYGMSCEHLLGNEMTPKYSQHGTMIKKAHENMLNMLQLWSLPDTAHQWQKMKIERWTMKK